MLVTPEVPRDNQRQVPTVSGQGHHINVMIRGWGIALHDVPV